MSNVHGNIQNNSRHPYNLCGTSSSSSSSLALSKLEMNRCGPLRHQHMTSLLLGVAIVLLCHLQTTNATSGLAYNVELLDSLPPNSLTTAFAEGASGNGEEGGSLLPMRLQNGTKYLCNVPSPGDAEFRQQRSLTTAGIARSASRLLQGMRSKCMAKLAGWWIYEVCFDFNVRQYHATEKEVIEAEYFLGYGKSSSVKNAATGEYKYSVDSVHGPYIHTRYYNGTTCDLTHEERSAEVRFYCSAEGEVEEGTIEVQEPSSCNYIVSVWVSQLCSLNEMRRTQQHVESVRCYKVADSGDDADDDAGAGATAGSAKGSSRAAVGSNGDEL